MLYPLTFHPIFKERVWGDRKLAELEAAGAATGAADYRVTGCWVVRATKRNRDLVARYPEFFATRFPGSSAAWVAALTTGTRPPDRPGIVWCDVAASRLFPVRNRALQPLESRERRSDGRGQ